MIIILSLISFSLTIITFLIVGELIATHFMDSKFNKWWRNNIIQNDDEKTHEWNKIWKEWIMKTHNHTASDLMNYLEENYKQPRRK